MTHLTMKAANPTSGQLGLDGKSYSRKRKPAKKATDKPPSAAEPPAKDASAATKAAARWHTAGDDSKIPAEPPLSASAKSAADSEVPETGLESAAPATAYAEETAAPDNEITAVASAADTEVSPAYSLSSTSPGAAGSEPEIEPESMVAKPVEQKVAGGSERKATALPALPERSPKVAKEIVEYAVKHNWLHPDEITIRMLLAVTGIADAPEYQEVDQWDETVEKLSEDLLAQLGEAITVVLDTWSAAPELAKEIAEIAKAVRAGKELSAA